MTTDFSPVRPMPTPDEQACPEEVATMTDEEFFAWLETQPDALGWGV
jgi:hypothetical protein